MRERPEPDQMADSWSSAPELRPDHERDCCGSEESLSMWGCSLMGGLLLTVGIIGGLVVSLVASGVSRVIGGLSH